eukprot:2960432-Alexandrium_andersonii.AAC.1
MGGEVEPKFLWMKGCVQCVAGSVLCAECGVLCDAYCAAVLVLALAIDLVLLLLISLLVVVAVIVVFACGCLLYTSDAADDM